MAWIYLIIAGICEVIWAVSLKYCDGIKMNMIFAVTITAMACSMIFLYFAMKEIPMGTSYAAWTGIGIIGTAIYGIFIFNEPVSTLRIISLCMIFVGIIGLKYTTST